MSSRRAKRRDLNVDAIQAVIEVQAELTMFDELGQRAIRGHDGSETCVDSFSCRCGPGLTRPCGRRRPCDYIRRC